MRVLPLFLLLLWFPAVLAPLQAQNFFGVRDIGAGNYEFSFVDVQTGVKTDLATFTNVIGYIGPGGSVVKTSTNEYIWHAQTTSAAELWVHDMSSGNLVATSALPDNIVGLEYDCNTDTIYGIWEGALSIYYLVWLDPYTGSFGTIGSVPGVNAYAGGSFSLDTRNGWYQFVGLTGLGLKLFAVDTRTGAVVHENLFGDNVHGIEYSCVDSATFGRWEDAGGELPPRFDRSDDGNP